MESGKREKLVFQCCPAGIPMTVICESECITGLYFGWKDSDCPQKKENCQTVIRAEKQLEEYFNGKRKYFDLPYRMYGTAFQKTVWEALLKIPYGETRSYSEIAELTGNPKAVRAVGMANHRNPLVILVPCHRVIGKNGSMTGYAGGLERKEMLLRLEKAHRDQKHPDQISGSDLKI